jgi:hypothetical protein
LSDFILDARAYIAFAMAEGQTNDSILSNLSHDIFGLAQGDELMLPRVNGYEKRHPFAESNVANQAFGNGSGLGCLLPILNHQKRKLQAP